jgi:hypothetical protein
MEFIKNLGFILISISLCEVTIQKSARNENLRSHDYRKLGYNKVTECKWIRTQSSGRLFRTR